MLGACARAHMHTHTHTCTHAHAHACTHTGPGEQSGWEGPREPAGSQLEKGTWSSAHARDSAVPSAAPAVGATVAGVQRRREGRSAPVSTDVFGLQRGPRTGVAGKARASRGRLCARVLGNCGAWLWGRRDSPCLSSSTGGIPQGPGRSGVEIGRVSGAFWVLLYLPGRREPGSLTWHVDNEMCTERGFKCFTTLNMKKKKT